MLLFFYTVPSFFRKQQLDLTKEEIEKRQSNTGVMETEDCITQLFECLKNVKVNLNTCNVTFEKKIGNDERKLVARIDSGICSWNILNKLLFWCRTDNPIKKSKGLINVNILKSFCDLREDYKRKAQYMNLLCNLTHLSRASKKIRETYKIRRIIKIGNGSWRNLKTYLGRMER